MSSQVIPRNTEAAILARIVEPDEPELKPEAARYLLSMKLPSGDEERESSRWGANRDRSSGAR